MSDLFDQTIAKVKELSAEEQEQAAYALIDYLDNKDKFELSDEQLAEIDRRIADPDRILISYEEAWRRLGLQD
jgi:putative addiction module component (TIGR02574 family)